MENLEMSSWEKKPGFRGSVGFKKGASYRSKITLATGLVGSLGFALEFYLSREPEIESG